MLVRLTEHEHSLMQEVLENAEAKYLQYREINPKTVFNLMKVLSAYNEILPKHGISSTYESRMLNYLVHINRRYNPQSKEEWKSLVPMHRTLNPVVSASRNSSNRSRSRAHSTIIDSSHPRNKIEQTSRISYFNPTSTNSKNLQHIPVEYSTFVNRSMSSFQIQTKSQMKASRHSRQPFDNKENSQIHINSNYVLCDKTAMSELGHTTFDSSFQQAHILLQQDEPLTEELQQMNERARLFHEVNLKTKVFLIFKATCLIHDEARTRIRNILRYCRGKQLQRYFGLMVCGVKCIREGNIQDRKAQSHFLRSTKRKVFGLLKILKNLEISRYQHSKYSSSWLVNEFTMWVVSSSFRADEELLKKYEYFLSNGKFYELALLFKVFGGIQPGSQEELVNFYQNARLSSKRRVFTAWKVAHQSEKRLVKDIHDLHLIDHTFQALKQYRYEQLQSKYLLKEFTASQDFRLLRRTFSEFMDNCRRARLERTKEEYVRQRNKRSLQIHCLSTWREKLEEAKSDYVKMQQTKVYLQEHYSRELKALVFIGGFKQYWYWRIHKKAMVVKAVNYQYSRAKERVFKGLVSKVLERKKAEYLSNKHQLHFSVKNVLNQWRRITGLYKLSRCSIKHQKRTAIYSVGRVSEVNQKLIRALDMYSERLLKRVLRQLVSVAKEQQRDLEDKVGKFGLWVSRARKESALKRFELRSKVTLDRKHKLTTQTSLLSFKVLGNSSKNLQGASAYVLCTRLLHQIQFKKFIEQLRIFHNYSKNRAECTRKGERIRQTIKRRSLTELRNRCKHLSSKKRLVQKRNWKHSLFVLSKLRQLKLQKHQRSIGQQTVDKLKIALERKIKISSISRLKALVSESRGKEEKAQKHYCFKLQERAMLLLRSIIIVRKQMKKSHQRLTDRIRSMLRKNGLTRFLKSLSSSNYRSLTWKLTCKRVEIISKKQFICRIRDYSHASTYARHRKQCMRTIAGQILLGRMRKRLSQKNVNMSFKKRLALKSFMACMYARLYSRKLSEIAYHHYKHKLMRTAIDIWGMELTAREFEASEETSPYSIQPTQQKQQIIDLLTYYSKP